MVNLNLVFEPKTNRRRSLSVDNIALGRFRVGIIYEICQAFIIVDSSRYDDSIKICFPFLLSLFNKYSIILLDFYTRVKRHTWSAKWWSSRKNEFLPDAALLLCWLMIDFSCFQRWKRILATVVLVYFLTCRFFKPISQSFKKSFLKTILYQYGNDYLEFFEFNLIFHIVSLNWWDENDCK